LARASSRRLWRRLTPRILIATSLAATLSVGLAGTFWIRFFANEIRVQVERYTEDVVQDNVSPCRSSPETFGRRRDIGRFDAYDASTLRSANPTARPPDPALLERLEAGERVPARVDWSWSGALGGAALMKIAPDGPCSLFELHWYAPPGSRLRLLLLVFGITVLTLAGTVVLSVAAVVRPLVRRLARLCTGAEHVGEDAGYVADQDPETDDVGELGRVLDRAHRRIRAESSRLRSREHVLLAHLEDVCHDLRTPLTAIQIALEEASAQAELASTKHLIRSALTDVSYTSELTDNLRLAAHLDVSDTPAAFEPPADLCAVVERAVARSSLLGKHRGIEVECATPSQPLFARGPLVWAERAVANLIHSAVSRGLEGGHVAILLEAEGTAEFRLTVVDDGPTETTARSGDQTAEETGRDFARGRDALGGGSGSSLTAEICRRNGWRMRVEPRRPHGRCQTLEGDRVSAPDVSAPDVPVPGDRADAADSAIDRAPAARVARTLIFREDAEVQDRVPAPGSTSKPELAVPRHWHPWRRLVPRIVLATGAAAVTSTMLIAGALTHFMIREILDGVGRYTRSVAADNVGPCLLSPPTWSKTRRVGRLDAYDASTLRSENAQSPPLDPLLRERLLEGDDLPGRLFWGGEARWGGIVLRRVAPAGPCSLFQLSWQAARGSSVRGLLLLVTLTLVTIGATMAVSTLVVVRPLLSRLSRLRRAAAALGSPGGYEPVPDHADDEIGRLATILDRTHRRVLTESALLRERQKQLERRLGDVAHDFRTPLSSALISLELAARLAKRKDATETIRRALTDLVYTAQLTENLRLLTQLTQGDEPPDGEAVTVLNDVVERVVARFALLGRHRGVSLEGAVPPRALLARGHPVWTEQALANVAHNAVTHSEAGSNVAVVLEAAGDDRFCVTVVDDGPGVAPPDLVRLTERTFRSGRARQRAPGGSGLGLAITAEICRQSGWTLRFEAEQPRGLRVTIEGGLVLPPDGSRHVPQPWARPGPPTVEHSNRLAPDDPRGIGRSSETVE